MYKRIIIAAAFFAAIFAHTGFCLAGPSLINLQGRLADPQGNPIKAPTQVDFYIYQGGSANQADSGTVVYKERVIVSPGPNGEYSHLIGSGTPLEGHTLTVDDFDTDKDVYLQMVMAGTPLLPRLKFVSSSYAFVANVANLAHVAETVKSGSITSDSISTGTLTSDQIKPGSIIAGSIKPDSITSNEIQDGTIQAVDLSANAVTTPKIQDGAVTASKIPDSTIAPNHIQSGAVGLTKIDAQVTGFLIPSGMIAMFAQSCPSGWTHFSQLDDRFPMGASSYSGNPGGSAAITGLTTETAGAHSHTVNPHTHGVGTLTIGAADSMETDFKSAGGAWAASFNHSHPLSGSTGSSSPGTDTQGAHTHVIDSDGSWRPPYLGVVFCQKN